MIDKIERMLKDELTNYQNIATEYNNKVVEVGKLLRQYKKNKQGGK